MKNKKWKIIFTAMAVVMLLSLTIGITGCAKGGGEYKEKWEALALDADAIATTVEAIKKDLSDLKAANDTIHVETDTILEGEKSVPDKVSGMVETTHMSSHALLLIMPYMKAYVTEIDGYKGNPEAKRGKILIAVGKTKALLKMAIDAIGTKKWPGLMEWPVTDDSPHDLVHAFMGDSAIKGVTEYKNAADALHDAMHGVEDATSSMELNLEALEDLVETAGKIEVE